jgi:hypothetical protein
MPKTVFKCRKMAEPPPNDFSGRFIELSDGCGGAIAARWGSCGAAGEEYVGL